VLSSETQLLQGEAEVQALDGNWYCNAFLECRLAAFINTVGVCCAEHRLHDI